MEFNFSTAQPCAYEGWLQKANIGFFERWQRRYFRIQGRCIYYFKKDDLSEPPVGKIPLVDIAVQDLPAKKGRTYTFSINLTKNTQIAKRAEYLLMADTEDIRRKWTQKIHENEAKSIVGEPFQLSTEVCTTSLGVHLTLPYFFPQILEALNQTGYKLRNIWTVDVPQEIVTKGLALLNLNYNISTEDIHNSVAIVLAFLRAMPEPFFPDDCLSCFGGKVNPDDIKKYVRAAPAPVRQFIYSLGMHFRKVLDNTASNGVTLYSLLPIVGPLFISPKENTTMITAQVKNIQDQVAQCFLQNASKILEDVHQFLDAPRQTVLRRARVIQNINLKGEEYLDASRGLLVYIVREDSYGWCTVYTNNRRVGLMHKSNLKDLSAEEEKDLNSGLNIDALMDVAREHVPEMMLLFDGMNDELMMLRDAISSAKR